MPEENQDANTEIVENPSESTTVDVASNNESKTQEEANSSESESSNEAENQPFHKHPRFQELVREKNQLKSQISNMERILAEKSGPAKPDPIALARKELTDLGMKEDAAEKVLNAAKLAAKAELGDRVNAVEANAGKREMDAWLNDFSKNHEDYAELEPQMFEVFQALPDNTKTLVVSDPMGLQLLYDHVKVQNMKDELDKSYKKGTEDGYKSKKNKSSISPTPGGSKNTPGEVTRKSVGEMSLQEYKKLRDEIGLAALTAKLAQES